MLKSQKVKDTYNPNQTIALIAREDEPLKEVLSRFVEKPFIRGIFVVDGKNRYGGMIKREDLLDWAKLKLGDFAYLDEIYLKLSSESKARDLLHRYTDSTVVHPDDDISRALKLMIARELTDCP